VLKLYSRKCNTIIKRKNLELWTESKSFLYQAMLFVSDPDNTIQAVDSAVLSSHSTVSLSALAISITLQTLVTILVFVCKLNELILHKTKARVIHLPVRYKTMKLLFSHSRDRLLYMLFPSVLNFKIFLGTIFIYYMDNPFLLGKY